MPGLLMPLPSPFVMPSLLLGLAHAEPVTSDGFPYPIHASTLDNGLRVYVVPMAGCDGAVAFATWMQVGSRNEVDPGRTGFAHFFEHLMFHGTPTLQGGERDKRILELGVEENAWTWVDETVYHGLMPKTSVEAYAAMEGDRFQHLVLTPEGVRREAGAVYGEFRKGQANPRQALRQALHAATYTLHPYGHLTIGLEPDIAAMPESYDAAMAFFDKHYRPQHAFVVVVGDVDPAAATALVGSTYGEWAQGSAARPEVPAEPPPSAKKAVEVPWSGPATPLLAMAWRIRATQNENDRAALDLAAGLLLSENGVLEQRLVREEKLAHAVYGGLDDTVDPGLFRVLVEAKEAAHLPRIEALIREEIDRMSAGVDPSALNTLVTRERYALLSSLDDPMTVLHHVGHALRRDPDPASIDRRLEATRSAPAEAVAAAVKSHLVEATLTVATLVSAPVSPAPTEGSP